MPQYNDEKFNLVEKHEHRCNPLVLLGMDIDRLKTIDKAHDMPEDAPDRFNTIAQAWRLPNETGTHSVYRINYDDGAQYVGYTGGPYIGYTEQGIVERLNQLFAELVNIKRVRYENPGFIARLDAGITYTFECLFSGFDEDEALRVESLEIAKLEKPLNTEGIKSTWQDPLAPAPIRYRDLETIRRLINAGSNFENLLDFYKNRGIRILDDADVYDNLTTNILHDVRVEEESFANSFPHIEEEVIGMMYEYKRWRGKRYVSIFEEGPSHPLHPDYGKDPEELDAQAERDY